MRSALVGLLLVAGGATARAETWVVAELPTALPLSKPQQELFASGAMPAIAGYRGIGPLAIGARIRAGVLRDGPAPGNHLQDPSLGGLASAGAALRIRARGGWFEIVGGIGLTGHDTVPAFEAGAGWDFSVGSFAMGPSLRYLRLQSDPMTSLGSADLLLAGIDVAFGGRRERARRPRAPAVVASVLAPVVNVERDRDALVDHDLGCREDGTGCESEIASAAAAGLVEVAGDRIVLDERVLFDFGRARIRSRGRDMIATIARAWRAHPEWKHITIEGHADIRGPDDFNVELSRRRAAQARTVLLRHGIDPARVDAIGYGRSRPRDTGTTEAAHQRNRRVEFVIGREAIGGEP